MGHPSGSVPNLGIESIQLGDLPSYNRHASYSIDVDGLGYEVDERGMEWWQRMASFQMPWEWFNKGGTQRRKILKNITFSVKSGQMLAVLGSSGSGKTTLLDVISDQASDGDTTGTILVNGQNRTAAIIKEYSAYVRQNDRLLPHLTVRETLMFVAQLKLPTSWTYLKIKDRVDSVIAELGLRHVADTKVGGVEVRGISGGERRRVSIGVQLLLDPSIIFLDEPTSGLDSFTAHHLMETLARLSSNNRIVFLTIHQPRSDIFELFDLIMLLSQGDVVYYGKANKMVDYFTNLGYPCPELTNPCDFYVDLTTVDMKTDESENSTGDRVKQLVEIFKERQDQRSRRSTTSTQTHHPQSANSNHVLPRNENQHHTIETEIEITEFSSDSPVTYHQYVNRAYVNEEDEVTEFNDQPIEDEHENKVESEKDQNDTESPISIEPQHGPSTSQEPEPSVSFSEPGPSTSQEPEPSVLFSEKPGSSASHSEEAVTSTTRTEPHDTSLSQFDSSAGELPIHEPAPAYSPPDTQPAVSIENGPPMENGLPMEGARNGTLSISDNTALHGEDKVGAVAQFWVLFRRALANNLEDYSFLGVQAIEALAMSLMIGLVFYNLGIDQISIRDRFGLLYIICALYPYMVILDVVGQYHRERHILYFEMQDNLYTAAPYFFAKVLSEIPEHTLFIVLYACPVYFMSGLQDDAGMFFKMFAICFIVVYASRAMAMWAGSFMPTYPMSVLLAQTFFTMFLLSCGFIFNLENLWDGIKWTSSISYLKWSYQAMCHIEFNGLNFECDFPIPPQSCINTGEEALKVYSLDGSEVWQCALIVCSEITIFLVLFFVGVKFISQKPHEQ